MEQNSKTTKNMVLKDLSPNKMKTRLSDSKAITLQKSVITPYIIF